MRRRDRAQQKPTGTRRAARELAFRVLFQSKQGQIPLLEALGTARANMRDEQDDAFPDLNDEALSFARELLEGYLAREAELDSFLQGQIRGWSFAQMAQTDLNIIRLATFEMLHTDTPAAPIIESAVRIARKFGGDDSGRFVNGVLGSIDKGRGGGEKGRKAQKKPVPTQSPLEPEGEA